MKYSREFNQNDMDLCVVSVLVIILLVVVAFFINSCDKPKKPKPQKPKEAITAEFVRPQCEYRFLTYDEISEYDKEQIKNYHIGDWIKITWWGSNKYGHIPPEECSATGQIQNIKGNEFRGTWGDFTLYFPQCAFQVISNKEYLEIRDKELTHREYLKKQKKKKERWLETITEDERKYLIKIGRIKE